MGVEKILDIEVEQLEIPVDNLFEGSVVRQETSGILDLRVYRLSHGIGHVILRTLLLDYIGHRLVALAFKLWPWRLLCIPLEVANDLRTVRKNGQHRLPATKDIS